MLVHIVSYLSIAAVMLVGKAVADTSFSASGVSTTGILIGNNVSLTTSGVTWGYLASTVSYLPNISTTNVSTSTINGVDASAIALPTGAIMAFDLASCPTGWSEYTAARGRFLRGIDNGAGNDPSGTRVAGNTQEDTFQGHIHSGTGLVSAPGAIYNASTRNEGAYGSSSGPATLGAYGAPRYSSETRPKNVAVLFCRKN